MTCVRGSITVSYTSVRDVSLIYRGIRLGNSDSPKGSRRYKASYTYFKESDPTLTPHAAQRIAEHIWKSLYSFGERSAIVYVNIESSKKGEILSVKLRVDVKGLSKDVFHSLEAALYEEDDNDLFEISVDPKELSCLSFPKTALGIAPLKISTSGIGN